MSVLACYFLLSLNSKCSSSRVMFFNFSADLSVSFFFEDLELYSAVLFYISSLN